VDAFEEWCHLFEGAQHEIILYSYKKKSLIFHDDSCVESMTISMGIIVVLILIHDYLSSMATIKETGCVVMSFVPCA